MNEDSKKLAIVTGAARGIGLATALMFNENGYKVAIVDNDKEEIDNLSFKNENLKTFCFDISNDDELEKMYSQILEWHSRIDVLVNNAGVADFGNIEETNFKRWNEVMKTNLDGVFLCSQKAISHLKKTKGNIINIGSVHSINTSEKISSYATSKAAIAGLTRNLCLDLGKHQIRVNSISPGAVDTPMLREGLLRGGDDIDILLKKFNGQVPNNFKDLEALPGVGHKTASVVMSQGFGVPAFAVDTHIHRLAQRWGLTNGKNVKKTEADLKKLFDKSLWNKLHLQIIFWGREFCQAKACYGLECNVCKACFPKRIKPFAHKKP